MLMKLTPDSKLARAIVCHFAKDSYPTYLQLILAKQMLLLLLLLS